MCEAETGFTRNEDCLKRKMTSNGQYQDSLTKGDGV
jgi:hypothetical protein